MNFFKYYLQLLVPLLVSFAGYQLLVTPLFEPIHAPKQSAWVNNTVPKREGLEWWEPFFREDSWQRNSPLIIQQEQCILLYQKREQLSDTRWRFSPLTIVIPQQSQGPQQSKGKNGDGSSKRAIFIENPRGAEIQFKHAFDWTVGHPPPVTQGQLSGSIQIYSPADPETGQGELHIETEDVRIDKRQIWTDKPIKMRLGGSRIEGRYLSIFMDQDLLAESTPTSAVKPPDTPFAGLD